MFGELAFLLGQVRCANVEVAPECKQAWVLSLEFELIDLYNPCGLLDYTSLNFFFQNLVHHLRFKLDLLRSEHPSHPLAGLHRKINVRKTALQPLENLLALQKQARAMAELLTQWNPALQQLA